MLRHCVLCVQVLLFDKQSALISFKLCQGLPDSVSFIAVLFQMLLFLSLIVFNMNCYICMKVTSVSSVLTEVLLVVSEVVGGTIVTCDSREEGSRIMSQPRCSNSCCPTGENDSSRCQTLTGFWQEQGFCWSCSSEPITELSHCHSFLSCWPLVCVYACA